MVVVVVAPDLGRVRFARPRKLRTPAPNAQQHQVSRSRIAEHEIIPRAGEERPGLAAVDYFALCGLYTQSLLLEGEVAAAIALGPPRL